MKSSRTSPPQSTPREEEAERFLPERDGPDLAYEHIHRYLIAASLLRGLHVLDLASGSGFGSRILRENGCAVTSLDLARAGLPENDPAVQADARSLPFRDGSFEAVVCFEAIEHLEHADRMLREVRRVLGGRAILLVSTPDRDIYTDRAGHVNPHHIAELRRGEFTSLLEASFENVRVWGQGLWAGSWVTALDVDSSVSASRRRKVDAKTYPVDTPRASNLHANWASTDADELPVPVYLLAACSNSTRGWNRINRGMAADSVLHDPAQWLLAHYARLVQEHTRGNDELTSQIDRARISQGDLVEQLRAAQTAIDEHESNARRARASTDILEEQIRESRAVADRQFEELERARAGAESQKEQLERARANHDDLQAQLERARANHEDLQAQLEQAARVATDQEDQITRARERIEEGERAGALMRSGLEEFEAELAQARETITRQRTDLECAELGAKELEVQIEASRASQLQLETERVGAREEVSRSHAAFLALEAEAEDIRALARDLESQLVTERSGIERREAAIDAARHSIADLERQVDEARSGARSFEKQIETARSVALDLEQQILEARTAAQELEGTNATLTAMVEARGAETESLRDELTHSQARLRDLEQQNRTLRESEESRTREIEALGDEIVESRRRIESLESEKARFWARLGHRISNALDASKGRD